MLTNISGFPEFLPQEQIAFTQTLQKIQMQFELHGFTPLETPAVERVSTLLSKGGDHEIYGLHRLGDENSTKTTELALRFDLTVPLARYVAQHYGKLNFPYRRYHIAPVWRGERPQSGRYRQFYQCDIDIIGDGSLSMAYDAEILSVVYTVFQSIGLKKFTIQINNRFLLTGLIQSFGIPREIVHHVMRILDKTEKISHDEWIQELRNHGMQSIHIQQLWNVHAQRMNNTQWIEYLSTLCDHSEFHMGLSELTELLMHLKQFSVPDEYITINPILARGLNYYTGTVSEIKLLDYPELGSICGGGRYANLVHSLSNKQLPGVGCSIGISRLIPKLIESGIIPTHQKTSANALVTMQNKQLLPYYIEIANTLRAHGIKTEIYLGNKSLLAQMKYANTKGFQCVIIANALEFQERTIILRLLSKGTQYRVSICDAISMIQ